MNPQNPQDPQNQQYQPYQAVETPPPTPMGNPFASSDVNFKPHHDRPRISVGKLLKRLSAVVVAFGMIAGIGYGVNYFLGIADREQQAYNARLIEEVSAQTDEDVYIGNGSDILEVKEAQVIQACPAGYEEVDDGCQKNEVTSVPAAQYSCPSGYTQSGAGSGTTCSRIEGGTKESIPASVQATCEAGYTLSGSSCTKREVAPFIVSFNCPAGYQRTQLAPEKVICSKQETVTGTLRTSCPSGFSVSGSGCVRSQAASASTGYGCPAGYSRSGTTCLRDRLVTCPSGYTFNGSNSCIATAAYISVREYFCKGRDILRGTLCYYNDDTLFTLGPYNALYETKRGCPSGYSNTGSSCQKTASPTFTCPNGHTRVGSGSTMKCSITASSNTSYSCPSGFSLSGTTCTQSAAQITSCDAGFAKAGSTCTRSSIVNQDASRQNTCPATFSIGSAECQREARIAAIQALSCGAGYTREGNQCTKINGGRTVTATPNIRIACEAGFTQVGTGSDAKCEKRELLSSPRIEQQACEEGWSKRIIGTTIDCVRTA